MCTGMYRNVFPSDWGEVSEGYFVAISEGYYDVCFTFWGSNFDANNWDMYKGLSGRAAFDPTVLCLF